MEWWRIVFLGLAAANLVAAGVTGARKNLEGSITFLALAAFTAANGLR